MIRNQISNNMFKKFDYLSIILDLIDNQGHIYVYIHV